MSKKAKISLKKKTISITNLIALFLAVQPVFDPYIIFSVSNGLTIKLNDLFIIIIGIRCFAKSPKPNKETGFLISWIAGLFVLELLSLLGTETSFVNALKNLMVWFVYAYLFMYIWKTPCREKFFQFVELIGIIITIVVLLQFVFGHLGIQMWDGKIPGLSLGEYDSWSGYIDNNTFDIRPCGILQEASYVGIYMMVAYVYEMQRQNVKLAALFAITMILTTSMVAVVGCAILTMLILMSAKRLAFNSRVRRQIIFLLIIGILVVIYVGQKNGAILSVVIYLQRRIQSINVELLANRQNSSQIRIIGNISLWKHYSIWQKIFGVGVAQYANYFNVLSYSNVFVTTILNSGLLGLAFLVYSLNKLRKIIHQKNLIYLIILLLVFASDYQWFSGYFFYLLSACILRSSADSDVFQSRHRAEYNRHPEMPIIVN